jgi:hypothetical protein
VDPVQADAHHRGDCGWDSRLACALLALLFLLTPLPTSSAPKQDWATAVAWKSYEDGLLTPDGKVAKIDAGRSKYRYFYDEADPRPLHAAMLKAIALAR